MAAPTAALQRFEDRKDDPRVQGLRSFILLTLHTSLSAIVAWNITQHGRVEDVCTFTLETSDGSMVEGRLHRKAKSTWQGVHSLAELFPWEVGTDWRYTF